MIMKSAKVIIYDKNGNILLLTRSETHPKYALHLDLPGGILENDESFESTVKRECLEEIGLDINTRDLELVKKIRFPHMTRSLFKIQLNDVKPDIKLSWEHSEYKWFSEEEIRKMKTSEKFDPYYNMLVEYLKNKDDKIII